jgi:SAM-dependent methyltransferase
MHREPACGVVPADVDSRRFQTAAAHYAVGRPPYPPELIRDVARVCGLTRAHRLLDLGTGPGLLAIAFAPFVGSVLAVDPEPAMLAIATEAVLRAGVTVEVREGSSETLGPAWGTFQAVTMGRSFHWMDRTETLRRLDPLVAPEGTLVLFNDEIADVLGNEVVRAWSSIVERYSADDTLRMERRSPHWQDHDSVLAASPFSRLDHLVRVQRTDLTVETLIHRALSMSATSASRLGPRAETMVHEIRETLAPFYARGAMMEHIEWTATFARRPRARSG